MEEALREVGRLVAPAKRFVEGGAELVDGKQMVNGADQMLDGKVASGAVTIALAAPVGPSRGARGGVAIAGRITGYRRHGIDQAISRDGVGVATRAILNAVRNPRKTVEQASGKIKYVGENATVILNQAGEVITTWARNRGGHRIQP